VLLVLIVNKTLHDLKVYVAALNELHNVLEISYRESALHLNFIHLLFFPYREEVVNSHQIQQALLLPIGSGNASSPSSRNKGRSEHSAIYPQEDDPNLLGALQHPFAITLFRERIYWTDWVTNSVHSLLKNGSGLPVVVKGNRNGDLSPMDLQVYNSERQKPG